MQELPIRKTVQPEEFGNQFLKFLEEESNLRIGPAVLPANAMAQAYKSTRRDSEQDAVPMGITDVSAVLKNSSEKSKPKPKIVLPTETNPEPVILNNEFSAGGTVLPPTRHLNSGNPLFSNFHN